MGTDAIKVVAALIRDDAGRVLLVRKRGTMAFMQPGGKRDAGEDDIAALAREIAEELGCGLVRDTIEPLGEFDAVAANEPGRRVHGCLGGVGALGEFGPDREIDGGILVGAGTPPRLPPGPVARGPILALRRPR